MADLHKQQLEDRMGDAVLAVLMDEYAEADGMVLLSLFENAGMTMPEHLDKTCQAEIRKYSRLSEKHVLLRRTACRAAKIAAVLIVICSLSINLILSVEAVRVPLLNIYLKAYSHATNFTFQNPDVPSGKVPENRENSLPIPAPKGYALHMVNHNHDDCTRLYEDSILFMVYQNKDGSTIQISTTPASGSFSIDTEDCAQSQMELHGEQALYLKKQTDSSLRILWLDVDRQRVYDLYASAMPEEEFLDYAEMLSGMFLAQELHEN